MHTGEIAERRARLGWHQTRPSPAASLSDAVPLQHNRVEARGGARMGDSTPGNPGADDDDGGRPVAAKPRI
jgi:hypothetical protein